MKILFKIICVFVVLIFVTSGLYAITVDEIINNVKQKEKETDNLTSDIVETISTKDTKTSQTLEGKLILKKPNKFYLEFTKPMIQKVISDGKTIWIYIPEMKQVMKQQVTGQDATNDPILAVGKIFETLQKSYDIVLEGSEKVEGEDTYLLSFTPKIGNENLPKMKTCISKNTWLPVKTDIMEMTGSNISIVFKNLKINTNVDSKLFEFKPPKDVEIINNPMNIPVK